MLRWETKLYVALPSEDSDRQDKRYRYAKRRGSVSKKCILSLHIYIYQFCIMNLADFLNYKEIFEVTFTFRQLNPDCLRLHRLLTCVSAGGIA
jgi:hypothetical protein